MTLDKGNISEQAGSHISMTAAHEGDRASPTIRVPSHTLGRHAASHLGFLLCQVTQTGQVFK